MASEDAEELTVTSEVHHFSKEDVIDGSEGGKFALMVMLLSYYPHFNLILRSCLLSFPHITHITLMLLSIYSHFPLILLSVYYHFTIILISYHSHVISFIIIISTVSVFFLCDVIQIYTATRDKNSIRISCGGLLLVY